MYNHAVLRNLLLIAAVSLISLSISAQRSPIRNFSSEAGLAHPQVWSIHQDFREIARGPFGTYEEYTNLGSGNYTFQVRASKRGDRWTDPEGLAFSVEQRWFETMWFRVLAVLGALLLIAGAVRVRMFRISERNRELENAVLDRTADLRLYARSLEQHSQALDRANTRIREADRIKSEFLANMSHELRTPLHSIIGFSDVLGSRLATRVDEQESRFLRNVGTSGRYLLLLINNLLDISKIEAGQMELSVEPASVARILTQTCEVVQGYAQDREIQIRTEVDTEMPMVRIDASKLNQILLNLLSNAIKFSEKGGEVVVRVERASDLNWRLEVEDWGSGIPVAEQERIFDKFRQAGGPGHPGGTGLGLALVKRFVRLMGGDVSFRSSVGEGSCFRVELPIRVEEMKMDSGEGWALEDSATRVLLVESETGSLARLAALLEAEDMVPLRTGREGSIELVEQTSPAVVVCSRGSGLEGSFSRTDAACILVAFRSDRIRLAAGFDEIFEELDQSRVQEAIETLRPLDSMGRRLRVLVPRGLKTRLDDLDGVELVLSENDDDITELAASVDLVIVAIVPELAGMITAHRIQSDRRTRHLPVIGICLDARVVDPGVVGYSGSSTVEDIPLIVHELMRRRSGRSVRRAASSLR